MSASTDPVVPVGTARRALPLLGLGLAEVGLLVLAYSYDFGGLFETQNNSFCHLYGDWTRTCLNLRFLMFSLSLAVLTFLILLVTRAGRALAQPVLALITGGKRQPVGLVVNGVGMALLLAPYAAAVAQGTATLAPIWFFCLAAGAALMPVGLVLWCAPVSAWRAAVDWKLAFLLGLAGIALPFFASRLGMQAWSEDALQNATFMTTVAVFDLLGYETSFHAPTAYLNIDGFAVLIGHPCAGLWGIVLSCGTILGFGVLMRDTIRLDRVIMILPLVAVLSWVFNVVRIVSLLLIGAHVSPELAVDGFHSYAGWISFMLIAGLMIVALDRSPWMQVNAAEEGVTAPRLFHDPVAALLLPFLLWLGASLVIAAIYTEPAYGYGWKVALVSLAFALLWRALPRIGLSPDPVAVVLGGAIAIGWIAGMGLTQDVRPFSDLWADPWSLTALTWLGLRLLGTALLVPIAEELFFRGYLQDRISTLSGRYGVLISALVVSALFAALHQVFWLAFVAGLIFTYVALRRARIWDAILCHATANLIIALYAVATNDLSLI